MSFISYSQNFEDIMLWRALKNIKHGFYIDVGANDPVEFSVTKAFYDAGWNGINIEPMEQYYNLLVAQRERDINLPIAISDKKGNFNIFEIKDTGLSTLDEQIAEQQEKSGRIIEKKVIKTDTLNNICKEYVHREINFLKIDVEGFEIAVLKSLDLQKYRPWIILIETTEPSTGKINEFEGEDLLINNNYKNIYFDGINTFYIANEKLDELEKYFKSPPNVFDRYELFSEIKLKHEISKQNEIINRQNQELYTLKNEMQALKNSLSWKITKPLRDIKNILKDKRDI